MFSCSDKYNLDTDQPSDLNSIYGYMQDQGNFKTYLQLIDDVSANPNETNWTNLLSRTGSMTLFPADDAAFQEFFRSNKWGVQKYEDLTFAQKRLLLKSSMIGNPYSSSMLSTAEGPMKGEVCRRLNQVNVLDSVEIVNPKSEEFFSDSWKSVQSLDKIVLFRDNTAAPIVHFNAQFLGGNKLESSDVDFLYNQPAGTRKSDEIYVNDALVVNSDVFCKNGFIHQVSKVLTPMDNMAELIRHNSNTSIYSGIIERFSAVAAASEGQTAQYNNLYGTDYENVFIKRYYSDFSEGGKAFKMDYANKAYEGSLKFDPGWNSLYNSAFNSHGESGALMEDLGVMLVPSNKALQEWWLSDAAKIIRQKYPSEVPLAATPSSTIDDLIRVNMFQSLVSTLPSKFNDVLDDANEQLGLSVDAVDTVMIGCNGAVYVTNKVFMPKTYQSVLFPTVIDTTNLRLINTAVTRLNYDAYLNSMVSRYQFFAPTKDGVLRYVDPVSYGARQSNMWEFKLDDKGEIYADVYKCSLGSDGLWIKEDALGKSLTGALSSTVSNSLRDRIEDILDNIIVVDSFEVGKKYYRTKGNSFVHVEGNPASGTLRVAGSMSENAGRMTGVTLENTYKETNGWAVVLDEILMTTHKSVADVLASHSEFSEFLQILKDANAVGVSNAKEGLRAASDNYYLTTPDPTRGNGNLINYIPKGGFGNSSMSNDKVVSLMNNYHYTVYAPTNEAMEEAYEAGLPTHDMLVEAMAEDEANPQDTARADKIRSVMLDFVKYHIQTGAVFKDKGFCDNTTAKETAMSKREEYYNEDGQFDGTYSVGAPYRLKVTSSPQEITVIDEMNRKAVVDPELCNMIAREYWIKSESGNAVPDATSPSATLTNASTAVVQGINHPLRFAADQFKYKNKPLHKD